MIQSIRRTLTIFTAMGLIFIFTGITAAQDTQKIDPCSLLSKADIKAAVGQEVSDGKLNTKANQAVGSPCEYKVGDYGAFSILVKTAGPGENADKVSSELKKMNISVSDATAGIGDRSFFSSPGYGMIQLNTFKGTKYLIITMLVPGATEAAQKAAAEKLMIKALTNI
jgi:hypothetical protein